MCFVCFCTHFLHEKAVAGELGQVALLSMCIHMRECIHLCVLALIKCMYVDVRTYVCTRAV